MMHLYSALLLYCCVMWGGISPQPPPVCSIHLDDATAATGQRHQCARHTPATGGEERVKVQIKCMLSPQPAKGGDKRERHRPNQEYALATHQLQVERRESKCQSSGCSHHKPATGGEERET